MPIYEYFCEDCKSRFEIFTISSKIKEKVKCKRCASLNVRKNLSAASFRMGSSSPSFSTGSLSGCGAKSGFK